LAKGVPSGPHSFRHANITWRQRVGGSANEASKIAGYSDLEMTGEYACVSAERQNELAPRIQRKLQGAPGKKREQKIQQRRVQGLFKTEMPPRFRQ
jgi:hypothetical protein